ncbi:MAG: hypothetical protein ACXWAV_03795 [Chthoniobacterales bacterium]
MKTRILTFVVLLAMASPLFADQPHMRDALGHLRSARAQLAKAYSNKGGHRERALEHVDAAIRETEAGIAYAQRH